MRDLNEHGILYTKNMNDNEEVSVTIYYKKNGAWISHLHSPRYGDGYFWHKTKRMKFKEADELIEFLEKDGFTKCPY